MKASQTIGSYCKAARGAVAGGLACGGGASGRRAPHVARAVVVECGASARRGIERVPVAGVVLRAGLCLRLAVARVALASVVGARRARGARVHEPIDWALRRPSGARLRNVAAVGGRAANRVRAARDETAARAARQRGRALIIGLSKSAVGTAARIVVIRIVAVLALLAQPVAAKGIAVDRGRRVLEALARRIKRRREHGLHVAHRARRELRGRGAAAHGCHDHARGGARCMRALAVVGHCTSTRIERANAEMAPSPPALTQGPGAGWSTHCQSCAPSRAQRLPRRRWPTTIPSAC